MRYASTLKHSLRKWVDPQKKNDAWAKIYEGYTVNLVFVVGFLAMLYIVYLSYTYVPQPYQL